jgi:D-alanine-D-alanine ligase-like ATP-grasp enzyme
MNTPVPNTCPDCGNAPVNHLFKKTSIFLDAVMAPFSNAVDWLWYVASPVSIPILYFSVPRIAKVLAVVKLGKIIIAPDIHTGSRARCIWEEAQKRGISMWEFRFLGMSQETFIATYRDKTIIFTSLPQPGDRLPLSLSWLDNKSILHTHFEKAGIPMAKTGTAFSWKTAQQIFERLQPPVIVKPHIGSRSRHTTTHITTLEGLEIAFKKAKQLSPWVIIEEELIGVVYRGTVIDGKVVGVLRREPPCVIGDGTHTISQLVTIENKRPERHGPIFHTIVLDENELGIELHRQGVTMDSIPEAGRLITLAQKSSRGLGGGATNVTEQTHSETIAVLEKSAHVLETTLVGIDFIVPDITKSILLQDRAGVIECNSMPFIDLHLFPLVGKPINTPGALWDAIFPASKNN